MCPLVIIQRNSERRASYNACKIYNSYGVLFIVLKNHLKPNVQGICKFRI
jgi:hypothetical protein